MAPALRVYGADGVVRPYDGGQGVCEMGGRGRRPLRRGVWGHRRSLR